MAFVNNLWGATASFEDEQVTDVTPGDVNEQVNDAVEVVDNANAIDNGTEIISQAADEIEALTEVQDKNEEVIADAQVGQVDGEAAEPAEVDAKVEAQLQESQEALNDALLILGGKSLRNHVRSEIKPAFESAGSKLDLLVVSNEGIGDFLSKIWEKFKAMLKAIKNFFVNMWNKIKGLFKSKADKVAENEKKLENASEEEKKAMDEKIAAEEFQKQFKEIFAAVLPAGSEDKEPAEVIEGLMKGFDELGKKFPALKQSVDEANKDLNTLADAIKSGKEVSPEEIKGMRKKITERLKGVYSAAAGIAKTVGSGISSILQKTGKVAASGFELVASYAKTAVIKFTKDDGEEEIKVVSVPSVADEGGTDKIKPIRSTKELQNILSAITRHMRSHNNGGPSIDEATVNSYIDACEKVIDAGQKKIMNLKLGTDGNNPKAKELYKATQLLMGRASQTLSHLKEIKAQFDLVRAAEKVSSEIVSGGAKAAEAAKNL